MGCLDDVLKLGVKPTLDGPFWSPRQAFLEFPPVFARLDDEFADFEVFFDREVRTINVGPQVVQIALSYLLGSEIYIDECILVSS